jgi:hypothetical protein
MLAQTIRPLQAPDTVDVEALHSLMTETEAPVSDAPTYSPQGAGFLLLLLLLSPKQPTEPKDK